MDDNLVMHWLKREDIALKTISYAQNHEDILLARVFPDQRGMYIDVGANHPIFHSVTKLFSDRGWTGINVEPSPPVFDRLKLDRPNDVNLNVGVGDEVATLTFFESPDYHGWSTFLLELAQHYQKIGVRVNQRSVPVTTLARICAEHVGDRTIDFLKVDAEGFEHQVLLGADFRTWRPRVLVVENAWTEVWEPLVLGADYLFAAFDGINRFYVRREDEALLGPLKATVNILDNFVPYEYVRLIDQLNEQAAAKRSFLDAMRRDGRRIARRLRKVAGRLAGRLAAG